MLAQYVYLLILDFVQQHVLPTKEKKGYMNLRYTRSKFISLHSFVIALKYRETKEKLQRLFMPIVQAEEKRKLFEEIIRNANIHLTQIFQYYKRNII